MKLRWRKANLNTTFTLNWLFMLVLLAVVALLTLGLLVYIRQTGGTALVQTGLLGILLLLAAAIVLLVALGIDPSGRPVRVVAADEAIRQKHIEEALEHRTRLLGQILELGNRLHHNWNLDSLLHEIGQSIGFETVVLNLVNEETNLVQVRAVTSCDPEARRLLDGAVYPWEEFTVLMKPEYRLGRCYFVPAGEYDWHHDFVGPVYVNSHMDRSGTDPEKWHPDDFLMVPIMLGEDQILGFFSVDHPIDGRRPTRESLLPLEILANQAAVVIENARLYEHARRELQRRQEAEARLRASLEEKEVLLKEIHHRVKNNLQVISSLLNLQAGETTDPAVVELYRESQSRIRSMALVHEKLYRSDNLARIDLLEYLSDLSAYLRQMYAPVARQVRVSVGGQPVFLDIDTAVPCGLLMNELISNAFKHAFPNGRAGEVQIQVHRHDDRICLTTADNGVGVPPGFSFRQVDSLGMQLVFTLVDQLDGTIEFDTRQGVRAVVAFPVPAEPGGGSIRPAQETPGATR